MLHRKPLSSARLALAVLGALSFCSGALADATSPPTGGEGYAPPIRGTKEEKDTTKYGFDAAEKAIQGFKYPKDLKVTLWAAEPMLCNVNAIAMDEKGNIFVAETNRYHGGVIDIRGAMNWLDEDIASKTVADRIKMIKNHASEGPGKEALESPESERIIKLQDTTGSGRADKATVFADGFNKPEDGLGSGILARHGSVFYTCIPSLYELRDTKDVGRADEKKVLSTGYGIRYAFLGHDLHGLVFGPDGKLYYSIGDRAANVDEPADKRHVENLESGGVFRCNPDGTGLEIFATGLRNPQELRFDQYGNLFTGDNNPDKGDPARWVNVVEDGDSGWREGYQYAEQMKNGGPWMAEQIWADAPHSNAHYINPCIQALGAGPSGLVYYPGTGLPARYNDHFFMCDFRGAAGTSGIWSIRNVENGASFTLVGDDGQPVPHNGLDHESIIYHLLSPDCEYGIDGGLYISDWINGWGRPNAGRIYHLFDEDLKNDPVVLETKKLIQEGMEHRSPEELIKLLGHVDMRVRQEAQFALAEKGAASAPALTQVAVKSESTLPRLHAIWGLGQIAAKGDTAVLAPLTPLLADKDLEVRCQAAKALGDGKVAAAEAGLLQLLKAAEPRARYFAAMSLGKIGDKAAEGPILEAIKENADKDATLRFGLVDAWTKLGDVSALVGAAKDPSVSVRLAATLALRRLRDPKIAEYLNDSDRSIVLEAARAINDFPITQALPELAAVLDKKTIGDGKPGSTEKDFSSDGPKGAGTVSDWVQWRAVNANYRLGTAEGAKRLATFAARDDAPEAVRVEALHDLGEWEKPPGRDRISDQWRPLEPRDPAIAKAAAKDIVVQIAKDAPDTVRIAATKLMAKLGLGNAGDLLAMVKNTKLDPRVRATALASLASTKGDKQLPEAVDFAIKDENPVVRAAAISAAGELPDAIKRLKSVLDSGANSDKQAAFAALGDMKGKQHVAAADEILSEWMDKLLAKEVAPEIQLDLLDAAGAERKDKELAAKIKKYDASRDRKDTLSPWRECIAGGDIEAGRKIFRERADVSCIRCHTAEGSGGVVGPRLDGVGAKQTRDYLLESIVFPNAKIAPGFETVVIQTKQGKYRTGVLRHEDDKTVELLNPDLEPEKQHIVVEKSDIKTRDRGPSAMPDSLIKTLSKRDLRNLVEFLASLKTEAKDETVKHGT